MKQWRTYWRPTGTSDEDWSFLSNHDSMDAAIKRAVVEWECHPDQNVIVMLFPDSTSPFWQGRVCWETPGSNQMSNEGTTRS